MDDSPLHDPLAVMCASVPGLVLTQTRKARVECEGQYCRGMIVTDMREHPFEAETVEFAVEVDEEGNEITADEEYQQKMTDLMIKKAEEASTAAQK